MQRLAPFGLLLILTAACSPQNSVEQASPETTANTALATEPEGGSAPLGTPAADLPAGAYVLDRSHASLLFRVNHLGFSNYTARFKNFDAQLQFDPANLGASVLTATVDARSIETDFPTPEQHDFNAQLQNEQFLSTAQYPQMTFRSTKVDVTGDRRMRVTGDLTLRGVTKPVVLDVTFNGGYAGHPMDPNARIGFSAQGSLNRSEFGMTFGIPEPGTTFGVSDKVDIIIEAELNGPPWKGAPPST